MSWSKRTSAEKSKWLKVQMKGIQWTGALLDRLERVTQKWLKKLEAAK